MMIMKEEQQHPSNSTVVRPVTSTAPPDEEDDEEEEHQHINTQVGDQQLDPSSISLFFDEVEEPRPSTSQQQQYQSSEQQQQVFAPTTTSIKKAPNAKEQQSTKRGQKNKATEVAKRRNINERIERLRSSHGLIFNVPQCRDSTMTQLAMFLRRLRKSPDVRNLMSPELMLKIFQEDANIQPKGVAAQLAQAQAQNPQLPAVISVNDLLGSDDEVRQRDDEDEITDQSSDDQEVIPHSTDEDDNDELVAQRFLSSSPIAISREEYLYYKQRMELLAADLKASTLSKRLGEAQQKARAAIQQLPPQVEFVGPPQTGNAEDDSLSCARCRPMISCVKRRLVKMDMEGRRNQKPIPMASALACGVERYGLVDDAIHPYLSLESAIPMERQVQKYAQVVSMLPVEIEQRRFRTAQLAYKKGDQVLRSFRNVVDLPRQLSAAAQAKGEMRMTAPTISLTIKKKPQQAVVPAAAVVRSKQRNRSRQQQQGDSDEEGSDDSNFVPLTPTAAVKKKKKIYKKSHHKPKDISSNNGSRRNTFSDSRRSSIHTTSINHHHSFGSSQFDFDQSVLDIGLPTITNMDCQEILLPSYRRKDVLNEGGGGGGESSAADTSSTAMVDCMPCSSGCPMDDSCWDEIRRHHAELETQERRVLLNPPRPLHQRSSRD